MTNLQKRICELRIEKGVSQSTLSIRMGWPKNSLERFESGRQTPTRDQQQKLADFFGVSLAYLRGETNDPTRQDSWMDIAYLAEAEQDPSGDESERSKRHVAKSYATETSDTDSTFLTAFLRSQAARDIIREIVCEELKKRGI